MGFCSANTFVGGSYDRGPLFLRGEAVRRLAEEIERSEAIVVGAGAGLSEAAGISYSGERFDRIFGDFRDAFGITDMYSGGFYPFPDLETYWGWWSRHIAANRYDVGAARLYVELASVLAGRDHFVITTNVDHQFQLAGIDPSRLFCTQGDYGTLQCSRNCSGELVENECLVRRMVEEQRGMRVPAELVPRCPHCGAPMVPSLRVDDTFCEDVAWHRAEERYMDFLDGTAGRRTLFLELGVGWNTPVIIKYPFWRLAASNELSTYACVNNRDIVVPHAIAARSVLHDGDLAPFVSELASALG